MYLFVLIIHLSRSTFERLNILKKDHLTRFEFLPTEGVHLYTVTPLQYMQIELYYRSFSFSTVSLHLYKFVPKYASAFMASYLYCNILATYKKGI